MGDVVRYGRDACWDCGALQIPWRGVPKTVGENTHGAPRRPIMTTLADRKALAADHRAVLREICRAGPAPERSSQRHGGGGQIKQAARAEVHWAGVQADGQRDGRQHLPGDRWPEATVRLPELPGEGRRPGVGVVGPARARKARPSQSPSGGRGWVWPGPRRTMRRTLKVGKLVTASRHFRSLTGHPRLILGSSACQ